MCLSLPDYQHQLRATTASLVLLRLDVVVYLELGLIWLLRRSVLQLPDRERERWRKLDAEVADVWDGAQTGWANKEYEKRIRISVFWDFIRMPQACYHLIWHPLKTAITSALQITGISFICRSGSTRYKPSLQTSCEPFVDLLPVSNSLKYSNHTLII